MTTSLVITMMAIGLLVGVSKTAIGGIGLLSAALIAQVMPAKESTGVLLILFLVGDLFAGQKSFRDERLVSGRNQVCLL